MKTVEKIPFTALESIPQPIKDFLEQKIQGFEDKIFSVENFADQIRARRDSFSAAQREVLAGALQKQYEDMERTSVQAKNLEALKNSETFTITTGHQLNLFTGPAFFVYKIVQVIKTCQILAKHFPEQHFVPMFWMATEDHDFAEINHFFTQNNTYEIQEKSGGAVGKIASTDHRFFADFENEFKDSVFGTEIILMLKDAYAQGNTLAFATRKLVQWLFSEYGLLAVDGDDAALKKSMIPVFEDELKHFALEQHSQNNVKVLSDTYGKVQVNPRKINLFYFSETRNRIDFDAGKYKIVDTDLSFSQEEILEQLYAHPEKFSPNALMRPVYQETVLPNLAYIGGNAEIMYWLELKDYFAQKNIPFPVLVPRNSMLFLSEKTAGKMDKMHLALHDFFRDFSVLFSERIKENSALPALLDQKEKEIAEAFQEIKKAASATEQSFANLVQAEEVRQLKSFARMRKRLLRAEKIKQKEWISRFENLYAAIHPKNTWQERVYNFSVFYADFGTDWIKFCLQEMPSGDSELLIVVI